MKLKHKGTKLSTKTYTEFKCNRCHSTFIIDDYENDPDLHDKRCTFDNCEGWLIFQKTRNYVPHDIFYYHREICSGYDSSFWYDTKNDELISKEQKNQKLNLYQNIFCKLFKSYEMNYFLEVPQVSDVLDYLYRKNCYCYSIKYDTKQQAWYGVSYLYDPFNPYAGIYENKTYHETKRHEEFKDAELELLYWMIGIRKRNI